MTDGNEMEVQAAKSQIRGRRDRNQLGPVQQAPFAQLVLDEGQREGEP